MRRVIFLVGVFIALMSPAARAAEPADKSILFNESFDDAQLLQRKWYDGDKFTIADKDTQSGKGCIEYAWKADTTTPESSSGPRRIFEPTETVYLRFHMRLSKGWGWSGRGYHPHLITLMTTENGPWHGPAASHLTVYVEPWNGKLRLAAQDIQNKDKPHGLTQGPLKGGFNGQTFDSKDDLFTDDKWHCVEAMFQLNSLDLKADKPNADGIVRGWFDGKLVVDQTNVILRSTDFPKMKFNQFLLKPYFGPGLLPHAQTLWIDELAVGTKRPPALENSNGMKLMRIPAGEFKMGSPASEKGRRDDEPERTVRLTRAFFIGQTEVTIGQFRKFVEATGYKTGVESGIRGGYGFDETTGKLVGPDKKYSWRFTGFPQTDEHPVVNVSWNDAMAFCKWLSEKDKRVYRLPTEAEWEYACRGGRTSAYCNGDDPEKVVEVGNIVDALAKEKFPDRTAVAARDGHVFTAPVGSFQPNGYGLHDMHGNVWEWTADWFGPPAAVAQTDPIGPETGKDKVVRGGDWYHDWSFARSAQRYPIHPTLYRRHAGFRVVCEE